MPTSGTGRRLALPMAAAALATTAAILSVGVAVAPRDIRVGPTVPVSPSASSALIDANNSPTVVRSPSVPDTLVAVNRIDRPNFSGVLHASSDGGTTWGTTALPLPEGRDRPFAPDAAFGPDGTLYVVYANLEGIGNDPQTLWLSTSRDGGRTLAAPTMVTGHYAFQARIAVNDRGTVFITWMQAQELGLLLLAGPPAPIVVAASPDRGAHFSTPVRVSDQGRVRVGGASPVIDSDGNLQVLYEDFKGDVRDFGNLDGPTWDQPYALVHTRSTDEGRTFSRGVELDSAVMAPERFLVYLPIYPSIAAGPDRSVVVAWSDARDGDEHVFLRRSTDAGASWGALQKVASTPAHMSSFLPRVAVAPDGRVDVLYLQGRRHTGDGLADAYLATSDGGSGGWRIVKVSAVSFDTRSGPQVGPEYLPVDFGTRLGLVSSDSGAVAVWTDTRLATPDSGRQDIAAARVDIPSSSGLVARLLISAGLLLAAVVALGARFLFGRAPGDQMR